MTTHKNHPKRKRLVEKKKIKKINKIKNSTALKMEDSQKRMLMKGPVKKKSKG